MGGSDSSCSSSSVHSLGLSISSSSTSSNDCENVVVENQGKSEQTTPKDKLCIKRKLPSNNGNKEIKQNVKDPKFGSTCLSKLRNKNKQLLSQNPENCDSSQKIPSFLLNTSLLFSDVQDLFPEFETGSHRPTAPKYSSEPGMAGAIQKTLDVVFRDIKPVAMEQNVFAAVYNKWKFIQKTCSKNESK